MGIPPEGKQKQLLEKYKVYIISDLGMGNYGFKYGIVEKIYQPDDLSEDMDELSLSKRLDEHRASGKSLIAKLSYDDARVTISPSVAYTLSVTKWEDSQEKKDYGVCGD